MTNLHIAKNQIADQGAVSSKTIQSILTNEEKAKDALQSVEGELKTLRLGINFTADQVACIIQKNPRLMQNITATLLNSHSFRKRIADEILAYLLAKEAEVVT